jgi:ABC-type sugar transport system ATPase subunit
MVLVGPRARARRRRCGCSRARGAQLGSIRIGERVVDDVAPRERDIAMVFQDYALYPQMSVRQNLAFGLKIRKLDRAEIKRTRRRDRRLCSASRRSSSASRGSSREASASVLRSAVRSCASRRSS